MECVFGKLARRVGEAIKYMTWASAACTAAVLVARQYPASELSQTTLQNVLLVGTTVLVGCGLTVLGTAIRIACFSLALDQFFTFEVTVNEGHQLCTRCPYSIVRHPAYTGWCIQTVGIALWNRGAGSWAREAGWLDTPLGQTVASVYVGVQVWTMLGMLLVCSQEDALMRKQFGQSWD